MRNPNSTRRFKALQDARDLIIAELAKPDVPQEQRTALLLELSKLQLAVSKKWKRMNKGIGKGGRHKGGRPKKMFDSQGEPLYNDSPRVKSEDTPSKKKFLEEITGGPAET
jgi:hypothetical protein